MSCEGHRDCNGSTVASFRVRYDGELLYIQDVCPHHEKLYEASKFAERLQQ